MARQVGPGAGQYGFASLGACIRYVTRQQAELIRVQNVEHG